MQEEGPPPTALEHTGLPLGTATHLVQTAASLPSEAQPGKPWYQHASSPKVCYRGYSRAVGGSPPAWALATLDPLPPRHWLPPRLAQSFLAWGPPLSSASACKCRQLFAQFYLSSTFQGRPHTGAGDSEARGHSHCPSGSLRSYDLKGQHRLYSYPAPIIQGSARALFPAFSKLRNILTYNSFPTAESNIQDAKTKSRCFWPLSSL